VKIRGFRRLGEIESLQGAAGSGCGRHRPRHARRQAARRVSDRRPHGARSSAPARRSRSNLPDYMLPAAFVQLDGCRRRRAEGDRRALPAPVAARCRRSASSSPGHTWNSLPSVGGGVRDPRVGVGQFWDLGGHSMLAVRPCRAFADSAHYRTRCSSLHRRPARQRVEDERAYLSAHVVSIRAAGSRPPCRSGGAMGRYSVKNLPPLMKPSVWLGSAFPTGSRHQRVEERAAQYLTLIGDFSRTALLLRRLLRAASSPTRWRSSCCETASFFGCQLPAPRRSFGARGDHSVQGACGISLVRCEGRRGDHQVLSRPAARAPCESCRAAGDLERRGAAKRKASRTRTSGLPRGLDATTKVITQYGPPYRTGCARSSLTIPRCAWRMI
jgi:hypothetical protein